MRSYHFLSSAIASLLLATTVTTSALPQSPWALIVPEDVTRVPDPLGPKSARPVFPLPYPRSAFPAICPRAPGNENWTTTGYQLATPDATKPTDDNPIKHRKGLRWPERLIDAPGDGNILNPRIVVGDQIHSVTRPRDLPETPKPGDLACSKIAETRWYQHWEKEVQSLPITLFPRIRYAFAFSSDRRAERLGMFLSRTSRLAWSHDYDRGDGEEYGFRGVVEFALTDEREVLFVLDADATNSSGIMGLYHLGP